MPSRGRRRRFAARGPVDTTRAGGRSSGIASDPAPTWQETADRLEIRELIGRYGYSWDEGHLDDWLGNLFVPDAKCTMRMPGQDERVVAGPEEMRSHFGASIANNQASGIQRRHCLGSVWVDELRADTAHAHAYMMALGTPRGAGTTLVAAGHYEFDLVKRDGHWRIAAWVLSLDGPPN